MLLFSASKKDFVRNIHFSRESKLISIDFCPNQRFFRDGVHPLSCAGGPPGPTECPALVPAVAGVQHLRPPAVEKGRKKV